MMPNYAKLKTRETYLTQARKKANINLLEMMRLISSPESIFLHFHNFISSLLFFRLIGSISVLFWLCKQAIKFAYRSLSI